MEQDNIQEAILQDELIDKFIRNKMTPEEEEAFKTNLANDPGLRERAFATAIMAKCMREKRQKEEKAFIEQLNESVAIDQDDRIERFIRDNMTPEEEAEFKDDLNYDSLKERALATSLMAKSMKEKRQEEEKAFTEQLNSAVKASSQRARIISLKEFMAIAASLLIYIGFGGYLRFTEYGYQQRNSIVAENISMGGALTERGEGDEAMLSKLVSIATTIKKDRDMTKVIAELQALYDKRLTDVDCAQNSATIGWYLALAYIKDDQKDKAKDVLIILKKEQPQMATRINKLLKSME